MKVRINSRISSAILTSSYISLLGKKFDLFLDGNSSLVIIWGLRFSIYKKFGSLFTDMSLKLTFFTFLSLVSWRTRAFEVVVFIQSNTLPSVLTRALVTRSLQHWCDINVCAFASKSFYFSNNKDYNKARVIRPVNNFKARVIFN